MQTAFGFDRAGNSRNDGAMRNLAADIPDARLVVLPGVGHMTVLEAPAAFTAALRSGQPVSGLVPHIGAA